MQVIIRVYFWRNREQEWMNIKSAEKPRQFSSLLSISLSLSLSLSLLSSLFSLVSLPAVLYSLYSLFSNLYIFLTCRGMTRAQLYTAPASAENCAQPATSGTRPLAVASSLIFMLYSVFTILYYLPSNLYSPSPLSILCPLIFII